MFFDSESRVLRVANAGAGRAFLGRRVGSVGHHECQELAGSSAPRYVLSLSFSSFPSSNPLAWQQSRYSGQSEQNLEVWWEDDTSAMSPHKIGTYRFIKLG